MATPIQLHPFIFYAFLFFTVVIAGFLFYFLWNFIKNRLYDTVIFIDKSDRWKIIKDKIGFKETYTYNNMKYFLHDAILNRKGKALYVFSVNKPQPMNIKYNNVKWLSSESLMAVINNKLVQQLVQTQDKMKDMLILYGSIGGLIAGIASVVILLKTFEVI